MPIRLNEDNDKTMLRLAFEVASSTDDPKAAMDPSSAVGAVIVKDGEVIAASANRFPPILRNSIRRLSADSPERYTIIEHAERCAIYDAAIKKIELNETTMYCTRFPCSDCARAIVYFGIKRLVLGAGFRHEPKWLESQRAAHQLLLEGGLKIRYLRIPRSEY